MLTVSNDFSPDWDVRWYVTMPSAHGIEHINDIMAWAKQNDIRNVIQSIGGWNDKFQVKLPTRELVTEFLLRFS
jgi:hypothetical protein